MGKEIEDYFNTSINTIHAAPAVIRSERFRYCCGRRRKLVECIFYDKSIAAALDGIGFYDINGSMPAYMGADK
jgi:hypothetical protein